MTGCAASMGAAGGGVEHRERGCHRSLKGMRAIIQPAPAAPVGTARLQEAEGRWGREALSPLGVRVET